MKNPHDDKPFSREWWAWEEKDAQRQQDAIMAWLYKVGAKLSLLLKRR